MSLGILPVFDPTVISGQTGSTGFLAGETATALSTEAGLAVGSTSAATGLAVMPDFN